MKVVVVVVILLLGVLVTNSRSVMPRKALMEDDIHGGGHGDEGEQGVERFGYSDADTNNHHAIPRGQFNNWVNSPGFVPRNGGNTKKGRKKMVAVTFLPYKSSPQYPVNHQPAVRTFVPLSEASSLVLGSRGRDEAGGDSLARSSGDELMLSDAKEGVDGRGKFWLLQYRHQ
ncbi:hypothetical protein MUK42_18182 [Musa troglodytarum]|uniref:Uncharacterized protein n=1 Tax=Musa troglodytarum TaxID=320322 RepID=A0A9E7HEE3_9LILI|nr:hypothetical protein MUK42_18182 [Musa troglodytarum]